MMKPTLKIDKRFKKKLVAKFADVDARAGILKDKPHKRALPKSRGYDSLHGKKVRKKSSKFNDTTLGELSERIRKDKGIDYLKRPFSNPHSKDIREMKKAFFAYMQGKGSKQEAQAALQLVIRNPIFKKMYGKNSADARARKGFDWLLIDTAQFFRNILAHVVKPRAKRNV
jgi:hypothetical protein